MEKFDLRRVGLARENQLRCSKLLNPSDLVLVSGNCKPRAMDSRLKASSAVNPSAVSAPQMSAKNLERKWRPKPPR